MVFVPEGSANTVRIVDAVTGETIKRITGLEAVHGLSGAPGVPYLVAGSYAETDRAAIADLSALDRHTDDMSVRDREWLWDRYYHDVPLARREKLLKVLARRTAERLVSRYIRDCAAGRRGEMAKGPAS